MKKLLFTMKKLLLLSLTILLFSCEDSDEYSPTSAVYLARNSVTVMAFEGAQIGDTGSLNGEIYTIVNKQTLREMVLSGEDVSKVCTSKITEMTDHIGLADVDFAQDISSWDVSNVTTMGALFQDTNYFNEDISDWDVSNVDNMKYMFASSRFNGFIGSWDVSSVTTMAAMFSEARFFEQPLNAWDTSNVTNMDYMFGGAAFNQPLNNWNVGNVTNMESMFWNAAFDQDISSWDVSNVTNCQYFGQSSDLSNSFYPNFNSNCN